VTYSFQRRDPVAPASDATRAAAARAEELAPDVYFIPGFGNAGFVVTAEGVVVVDTSNPSDFNAVVSPLRQVTTLPVRYIIYTHGHADHAANARPLLEDAAARGDPRPRIVAHRNVTRRMDRYAELYGQNAFINRVQFQIPPELPSFPPDFLFVRPDITYDDRLLLRLGGLALVLNHALGETDDITWVHLPERRALFSGDLIISSCPNIGNPLKVQRYEVEWAEALERMAALEVDALGPGHGPVLRGDAIRETLLVTARALRYLHDEVVRRLNAGQWEEQIVAEVTLPPELASHPALAPVYGCPTFIVHAIARRYAGWYDGNPSHLAPSRTDAVAAEVVALAGAEALLERAEALAAAGKQQLALHLLDYVIDGSVEPALRQRARHLKSVGLRALAESETSFIARSVLTNAAQRIADAARTP
jgi:alkyl sulfatase BDS1-like metallo-beta-lactamase superfamily hydrolase